MDWDPDRPRVSEEFGDAVVVCGAVGLLVGLALGQPAIGGFAGLILGVIADGTLKARELARQKVWTRRY